MPASNMVPLLTFEASAGAGFNGNPVAAESSGVGGPGGAGTGAATGSANLMYSLHRRGFGIDAGNAAYGDYYPQQADNKFMPRDIGSVTVYFMPTRSTRVDVSETFKNLPEFAASELHEAAFGDIIPPNQPIGVTVNRYTRYGTTVDVSQRLSHRARADMSAGYGHGMLPSSNWTVLTFSGDLNYLIAKGIVVYGGYEYGGQTFYVPGAKSVKENHPRMNGGIDFTRALSFSRRTTLSFSAGTAGVHDRVANTTVYHLVGSAELQREFGRTWNAAAVYGRNVRYSEALFEPIFSDSLAVVLSGSFSRRLDVKSVFTAARGHIGATTGSNADSYYGVVQFSYGISRSLALGADYLYSHLTSTPTAIPVSDLTDLSQQSVRVYVKLWVPLMSTARRP